MSFNITIDQYDKMSFAWMPDFDDSLKDSDRTKFNQRNRAEVHGDLSQSQKIGLRHKIYLIINAFDGLSMQILFDPKSSYYVSLTAIFAGIFNTLVIENKV